MGCLGTPGHQQFVTNLQDEVATDTQDLNMMEETAEKTTSTGSATRKPYEKPAFRHERVFETMALSCGKMQGTQGQCHSNRKNS